LLFGGARRELHIGLVFAEPGDPRARNVLLQCEALELRARLSLSGVPTRIASQWIFTVVARTLATLDARAGRQADARLSDEELASIRQELGKVQEYVDRAAVSSSRQTYVFGVLGGLAALVAATVLVELAVGERPFETRAAIAVVAGALGAAISVFSRLASGRSYAPDLGLTPSRLLGAMRPALGATFGTAAYFAMHSKFLVISESQSKPTYAAIAFLCGFGERFAQETLELFPRSVEARPRLVAAEAATTALVAHLPDVVQQEVRATLLGAELQNWRGYVDVAVEGAAVTAGGFTARPRQKLVLVVTFDARGRAGTRIDIRDGVDADRVVFDIELDSETVDFAVVADSVPVAADGEAYFRTSFAAPATPGDHQIWVHVTQHNQVVQLVPVDLRVIA
jgi:hypothetical protein